MSDAVGVVRSGHPISHMDATEVAELWANTRDQFEEIGRSKALLGAFVDYEDQKPLVAAAGEALGVWRQAKPGFFAAHPYNWIGNSTANILGSEAGFQVRALELAISLWEVGDQYPIDVNLAGDILVRQTIVPQSALQTPRVASLRGHGGVLVPLGWFETVHYGLEGARRLAVSKSEDAEPCLVELICRTLADLAITTTLRRGGISAYVYPEIQAIARPSVVRAIASQLDDYASAEGDLDGATALPGTWSDFAYASLTATLAHETAHILSGEHEVLAAEADEDLADDLAFDMTARSRAWQLRCPDLPILSPLGKTAAAFASFIFVVKLRLGMDRRLIGGNVVNERPFRHRADRLQMIAAAQKFPSPERDTITDVAAQFSATRDLAERLVDRLYGRFDSLLEVGSESYLHWLHTNAPEGSYAGL